jgi:hypothetical protein
MTGRKAQVPTNGAKKAKGDRGVAKGAGAAAKDEAAARAKASTGTANRRATPNPLLEPWTTPFEMPPFDRIRAEHFLPAFEKVFADNIAEVEAIAKQKAEPTFANTIEALERAGRGLSRVGGVFFRLAPTPTRRSARSSARSRRPMPGIPCASTRTPSCSGASIP